jgi:hypothetical protein
MITSLFHILRFNTFIFFMVHLCCSFIFKAQIISLGLCLAHPRHFKSLKLTRNKENTRFGNKKSFKQKHTMQFCMFCVNFILFLCLYNWNIWCRIYLGIPMMIYITQNKQETKKIQWNYLLVNQQLMVDNCILT